MNSSSAAAKIQPTRARSRHARHGSPGSSPTQSLGRWIDNLLGDKRYRERAEKRVKDLLKHH